MNNTSRSWTVLRAEGECGELRRQDLSIVDLQTVWSKTSQGLSVVVTRPDDAEDIMRLRTSGEPVTRRIKHAKKPLSEYLPKSRGVAWVFAPYRDAGQVKRAVQTLCESRGTKARVCKLVLELESRVFDTLMTAAPSESGERRRPVDVGTVSRALAKIRDAVMEDIPAGDLEAVEKRYHGASEHAEWVRRLTVLAAHQPAPVLIIGETGTGKEIVARKIHELSCLPGQFVPVNCAAIPSELLESQMFGHAKGAFTGAHADMEGLLKKADRGTLFLDEIGELSLGHQAKLLRALEPRDEKPDEEVSGRQPAADEGVGRLLLDLPRFKFFPLGEKKEVTLRARIIVAANTDLDAAVSEGRFREDLYYRLNNFRIRTPALKDHPEDIPVIAGQVWAKVSRGAAPLPADVISELKRYPWPGNVRELRSFLANVRAIRRNKNPDLALVRAVFCDRLGLESLPWVRTDL